VSEGRQLKLPLRRFRIPIALLAIAVALFVFRAPLLTAAGWALVREDPIRRADVVVVPAWAGEAGSISAADLVHQGYAPRVAVLESAMSPAERELIARGILDGSKDGWYARVVQHLGVKDVEQINDRASGTESEGGILPEWCLRRGYRSIIVVSTPDHSRRVRRVLRRTTKSAGIDVIVRTTKLSEFDPSGWWKTRGGVRTEIVEIQKLLLDVLRHPTD